jgi:hypothetical protein
MVMQPPSGTVTFPFTDIEGSTRLWEERPDEMRAMVADHDERFRSAIEHNGGYGLATGGDEVVDDIAIIAIRVDDYVPPTWLQGPIPKQAHLDIDVDDLGAAESRAVSLGAIRAESQRDPDLFLVLLDPAGHPFRLTTMFPLSNCPPSRCVRGVRIKSADPVTQATTRNSQRNRSCSEVR